ncbi:hypothetical protein GUITHDRAFT_93522 [Guillardia theta CCMP2712]|uniref:Succinate-semialdehyde dehydrogenase, mitochondrial n=1 Tax=Guillardia theta (strain CCMP2712) TaxID=905079 RepID=L1JKM3_GUITC|nr:hypothetical protein GUITHDRAFT_93522 [Guillardia theta CCMP2712]EKX48684.1 hypothetical protein GUITHDRAFT_93522 [Guillardia theta CCMP2712]|eukprot:XP_005835664.1 hypothetical protein GUITHDRAFT_93522 [Guillardia theta CCMP2712]
MPAGVSKQHSLEGKKILVKQDDPEYINRPNIDGAKYMINGEIRKWDGAIQTVYSPIFLEGTEEKVQIGCQARLTPKESLEALDAAVAAWGNGAGEWPQMSLSSRIACMEKFVELLKPQREIIVKVLMWEICKVRPDAEKEFDRTMDYINATIKAAKELHNAENNLTEESGILAMIRRKPIGVMLNLGPFNYPFNETYTTLIPAILMGNTCVMKLPNVGCLAHIPTMEAFAQCFPKGVVNFISGAGRETMPPIMETGKVDIFAFIGGSKAADALIKNVPNPHKLKLCLSLEAKNVAIVMEDADLDNAVSECVLGSLSYNGQRCTALKQLMIHTSVMDKFMEKFVAAVGSLKAGLPWEEGVQITPLPEPSKPEYLAELRADAMEKGANVVSPGAAQGWGHTMVFPSIVYPTNMDMRVMQEEQFGPLVSVGTFSSMEEIADYVKQSKYGQQAAVFTSSDVSNLGPLLDVLVNCVSRVNVNSQCQRSPDSFPFTGRKSSALGTLSVVEALKPMIVESLVATKGEERISLFNKVIDSKRCTFLDLQKI